MGSSTSTYDKLNSQYGKVSKKSEVLLELFTTKQQRLKHCFSKNLSKLLVYAPGIVFLYETEKILDIRKGNCKLDGNDLAFDFRDLLLPKKKVKTPILPILLSAVFTKEEDILFSLTTEDSIEVWKYLKSNLYKEPKLIENFKHFVSNDSISDINLSPTGDYLVVESFRANLRQYPLNTTHYIYDLQKQRIKVQEPYGDLKSELQIFINMQFRYRIRFIPHSMNDILCIGSNYSQDHLFYSIDEEAAMVKNVNNLEVISSTIDFNRKQIAYSYVDSATGDGIIALSSLSNSEKKTLNIVGKQKLVDMLCFNSDGSKIAFVSDTFVNVLSLQNQKLVFSKKISDLKMEKNGKNLIIMNLTFITYQKREIIAITMNANFGDSSLMFLEVE